MEAVLIHGAHNETGAKVERAPLQEEVMRHSTRSAKEICSPSASFSRSLNSYALAPSAAGVSVLALAPTSQAKIVYTRTHHVIGNRSSYNLDLNHDGVTDLTIRNKYFRSCTTTNGCRTSEALTAMLAGGNQVVYNIGYGAVAIKPGVQIGAKRAFHGGLENMADLSRSNTQVWGSWINVKNRYLGVKFKIDGETHYGWARLSVQVQFPLTIAATLTGYAYETVPNKPIIAGQTKAADEHDGSVGEPEAVLIEPTRRPATLGLLAMGSSGLSIWRREESLAVAQ
jgi:hypothetical protein